MLLQPPGYHAKWHKPRSEDFVPEAENAIEAKFWCGEDCMIVVWFDENQKVCEKAVRNTERLGVLELFSHLFGWAQ